MSDLDRSMTQNWYHVLCVHHIFLVSTKTPWIRKFQGRQVSP